MLCSCGDTKNLAEEEMKLLEEYIAANNITVKPTSSGLYYIETLEGSGEQAVGGKTVTVHYTGKLIDGTVFDSSVGRSPFSFQLGVGKVIPGWDEGVAMMKVGGKATLIIPSSLGYGTSGSGKIPPYSTLIFDVELLSMQ